MIGETKTQEILTQLGNTKIYDSSTPNFPNLTHIRKEKIIQTAKQILNTIGNRLHT